MLLFDEIYVFLLLCFNNKCYIALFQCHKRKKMKSENNNEINFKLMLISKLKIKKKSSEVMD